MNHGRPYIQGDSCTACGSDETCENKLCAKKTDAGPPAPPKPTEKPVEKPVEKPKPTQTPAPTEPANKPDVKPTNKPGQSEPNVKPEQTDKPTGPGDQGNSVAPGGDSVPDETTSSAYCPKAVWYLIALFGLLVNV